MINRKKMLPVNTMIVVLIMLVMAGGLCFPILAVPAFPGAEGFGAVTVGGRGGTVYHVTNLKNDGEGSFRAAVEAKGPRTVVFDVSGIIQLTSTLNIKNSNITIAGQTAPGDGITIAGENVDGDMIVMTGGVSDVLVRYMRFRRSYDKNKWASWVKKGVHYNYPGPQGQCFVGMDAKRNIMMDHISVSWGMDENFSMYRCAGNGGSLVPTKNMTIQWCLNAEALNAGNHAFANTWGGQGANFHHNLLANCVGRNPSISFSHFLDHRNNTIFNWRDRSMDGGGTEAHVNIINNYYKPGPATGFSWNWEEPFPELKVRIVKPEIRDWGSDLGLPAKTRYAGPGVIGLWHVNGNVVEGYPEVSNDNWLGKSVVSGKEYTGVQWDAIVKPYPGIGPKKGESHPEWKGQTMQDHPEWARSDTIITHVEWPENPKDPEDGTNGKMFVMPDLPTIATQSAMAAHASVLEGAGAILPVRDAVDKRIVEIVASGNATSGPRKNGIINHPDEVGGFPKFTEIKRPADWDSDNDGMPDAWETAHGLNPDNADDRNDDFDKDDYTNLEEYLNEVGAFKAVQAIKWDGEKDNRYARIENWDIAFQPSRFDTAIISGAKVVVDAIGQHAGMLQLTKKSSLEITEGRLNVAARFENDAECTVVVGKTGSLIAEDIVNDGTMTLTGDAKLTVDGVFTNNGILDVTTWNGTLPSGFVNNGKLRDGASSIQKITQKSARSAVIFNVTNKTLLVRSSESKVTEIAITVFNVQGKLVGSWNVSTAENQKSITLKPQLGHAIYFFHIEAGDYQFVEKLMWE